MAHDFEKFPELTNSQAQFYYWESPHRQIFEDFNAKVVEVLDGDTVKVLWSGRNFPFKIRFSNIAAKEKSEEGGKESTDWLKDRIDGKMCRFSIDPANRVGKFGRLIASVSQGGSDVGLESIAAGINIPFGQRRAGQIEWRWPKNGFEF